MHSQTSLASKGAIGIDFGTTNSSIAFAGCSDEIQLAKFPYLGAATDAYRSLLYLEQVKEEGVNVLKSWTGPEGIEHYLSADVKGRLIQSLKSFLSSRTLHGTEVFGRRYTLEDLIAKILRDLRKKAERQFGIKIRSAVVGRPVHFVGAENQDDDRYAEERLRLAFESAGYESVEFEMEPVAAAHYYESTLDHDELILIGDFGGGTSDFSLVHVGPTVRRHCRQRRSWHCGRFVRCEDRQAPGFAGSGCWIATAVAGQDPAGSELGLHKIGAMASSLSVARQRCAEHAERCSRAGA